MKRHRIGIALLMLATSALLAGCWGSSKDTALNISAGEEFPLATATSVGVDKCYTCHSAWRRAGEDNTIFNNWLKSKHGTPAGSHVGASCNPCHNPAGEDQSRILVLGPDGSPILGTGAGVGCEACHGNGSEHNGIGPIGSMANGYFAKPATAGQSSQYNTCTGCHLLPPGRHSTSPNRWIIDTHFDNGARAVGSNIQGYVLRKPLNTSCSECHVAHEFNNKINSEWKASAHGDMTGEAWKHYKWTGTDRKACQRCHTTTGYTNFIGNIAGYNPDMNYDVNNPDHFYAVDNQSEMLYCTGCHSDVTGGVVRNPGRLSLKYADNTTVVFPEFAKSNGCAACHSGTDRGSEIANSTANFTNTAFVNSHYFATAATIAKSSGYEFDNLAYDNPADYLHDKIGVNDNAGTGFSGPCVGCHMTPADGTKHLFQVVSTDNTGAITAIRSQAVCENCHAMDAVGLEAKKVEYAQALEALQAVMASRNFFFANAYPYIFKTADNTSRTNGVTNWVIDNTVANNGKNNMGACFNFNLLAHEPGAFTHNSFYARRLIYDSIDWLDNFAMDDSVLATLTSPPYATQPFTAGAINFISPTGLRPGDPLPPPA